MIAHILSVFISLYAAIFSPRHPKSALGVCLGGKEGSKVVEDTQMPNMYFLGKNIGLVFTKNSKQMLFI